MSILIYVVVTACTKQDFYISFLAITYDCIIYIVFSYVCYSTSYFAQVEPVCVHIASRLLPDYAVHIYKSCKS